MIKHKIEYVYKFTVGSFTHWASVLISEINFKIWKWYSFLLFFLTSWLALFIVASSEEQSVDMNNYTFAESDILCVCVSQHLCSDEEQQSQLESPSGF